MAVSKPFDRGVDTSGDVISEVDQREYYAHLGDGVINDTDGSGLNVTTDGTRIITVKPGTVKVQGLYGKNTVDTTFDLAGIGTQPAAGQSRIDVLVARLDMTAKTISLEVVAGTPAASPTRPALTNTAGGTWEVALRSWTYTGAGLTSTVDERRWLGPSLYLAWNALLPPSALLGTTVFRRDIGVTRRVMLNGSPVWLTEPRRASGTASLSVPTNGAEVTIAHNLGWTPTFFSAVPIVAADVRVVPSALPTSSQQKVRVYGTTGTIPVRWFASE
jgi:hypothetical protein